MFLLFLIPKPIILTFGLPFVRAGTSVFEQGPHSPSFLHSFLLKKDIFPEVEYIVSSFAEHHYAERPNGHFSLLLKITLVVKRAILIVRKSELESAVKFCISWRAGNDINSPNLSLSICWTVIIVYSFIVGGTYSCQRALRGSPVVWITGHGHWGLAVQGCRSSKASPATSHLPKAMHLAKWGLKLGSQHQCLRFLPLHYPPSLVITKFLKEQNVFCQISLLWVCFIFTPLL